MASVVLNLTASTTFVGTKSFNAHLIERLYIVTAPDSTAATSSSASLDAVKDTANDGSSLATSSTATADTYTALIAASAAAISSSASFAGTVLLSGGSRLFISSTASYTGTSAGGGTFTIAKDVWTINITNNAASRYTEFDYSGLAFVNGKTYAVGDGGIFELTGSVDSANNVKMYMEAPAQRVENHILSPRYAYIIGNLPENTATAAPGLAFQIMTDDKERYEYDIDPTEQDMQTSRVVFGRGLRSRHVRYALKGEVSEPATITSIDVYFDETRRGVK